MKEEVMLKPYQGNISSRVKNIWQNELDETQDEVHMLGFEELYQMNPMTNLDYEILTQYDYGTSKRSIEEFNLLMQREEIINEIKQLEEEIKENKGLGYSEAYHDLANSRRSLYEIELKLQEIREKDENRNRKLFRNITKRS